MGAVPVNVPSGTDRGVLEIQFGTNPGPFNLPCPVRATTLDAKVGESIRIVNQDDEDFMVGPFFVKAKATVAMRFTREGTLVGTCDMNAEGEIVITVTA